MEWRGGVAPAGPPAHARLSAAACVTAAAWPPSATSSWSSALSSASGVCAIVSAERSGGRQYAGSVTPGGTHLRARGGQTSAPGRTSEYGRMMSTGSDSAWVVGADGWKPAIRLEARNRTLLRPASRAPRGVRAGDARRVAGCRPAQWRPTGLPPDPAAHAAAPPVPSASAHPCDRCEQQPASATSARTRAPLQPGTAYATRGFGSHLPHLSTSSGSRSLCGSSKMAGRSDRVRAIPCGVALALSTPQAWPTTPSESFIQLSSHAPGVSRFGVAPKADGIWADRICAGVEPGELLPNALSSSSSSMSSSTSSSQKRLARPTPATS